jgi:hypothetical protein
MLIKSRFYFFHLWLFPLLLCLEETFSMRLDTYSCFLLGLFLIKKILVLFVYLEFILVYSIKSTM